MAYGGIIMNLIDKVIDMRDERIERRREERKLEDNRRMYVNQYLYNKLGFEFLMLGIKLSAKDYKKLNDKIWEIEHSK